VRRLLGLTQQPDPMLLGLTGRLEPMLLGLASTARHKEDYWVWLGSQIQRFLGLVLQQDSKFFTQKVLLGLWVQLLCRTQWCWVQLPAWPNGIGSSRQRDKYFKFSSFFYLFFFIGYRGNKLMRLFLYCTKVKWWDEFPY